MILNNAELLAHQLITQHIPGWTFGFDNSQRRFGACYIHSKHISMSRHLVEINPEPQVRETILHEIAHALAGPGHHHDQVFRDIARRIGSTGKTYHDAAVPEGKFIAMCPNCSRVVRRVRPPRRETSCGKCSRVYNPAYKLVFVKVQ